MRTPISRRAAFTLIETLTALAVLSFMVVILAGMGRLVSGAWREGAGRVDNFTKSRAMLDYIAADLQNAVIRPDLPIFQTGGTNNATGGGFGGGNYSACFVTRMPGISGSAGTPTRNVSCVLYQIVTKPDPDKIVLQRSDLAVPWDGGAGDLPFGSDLASSLSGAVPRSLAPGVVGFQFAFRRADGTVTTTYTGYVAANPVVAVGIALAVIGQPALQEIPTQKLQDIEDTLANSVTAASSITSIKAIWDAQLTSSFYQSYPKALAVNLKTFERWVVPSQAF